MDMYLGEAVAAAAAQARSADCKEPQAVEAAAVADILAGLVEQEDLAAEFRLAMEETVVSLGPEAAGLEARMVFILGLAGMEVVAEIGAKMALMVTMSYRPLLENMEDLAERLERLLTSTARLLLGLLVIQQRELKAPCPNDPS